MQKDDWFWLIVYVMLKKNIEDIDYIFDLATLTGASIGAFGGYTTAVLGYSEKLKKKISKASKIW